MRNRIVRTAAACLAGLVIAFAAAWWLYGQPSVGSREGGTVTVGTVGGPFRMSDQDGREVTERSYAGRMLLVYFGYTFCPDVCPTELGAMAAALEQLGPEAGAKVQPLFVTVDPERDTPEHLREYTALFHPALRGLTGTPEQVKAMAQAYKAYYARREAKTGSDYLMDHSSFIYLMGTDGYLLDLLPAGSPPDKIAEAVRRRLPAAG